MRKTAKRQNNAEMSQNKRFETFPHFLWNMCYFPTSLPNVISVEVKFSMLFVFS